MGMTMESVWVGALLWDPFNCSKDANSSFLHKDTKPYQECSTIYSTLHHKLCLFKNIFHFKFLIFRKKPFPAISEMYISGLQHHNFMDFHCHASLLASKFAVMSNIIVANICLGLRL